MRINRRDLLRFGGAGLALGAVSPLFRCPFISRPLQAMMLGGDEGVETKKLLVIFLRGGVDNLSAIIPHGDEEYDTVTRPTLYIDPDDAVDLNGFASANSALTGMIDEIPDTDIAWIQRVGYPNTSRSHFDSQQYWETAEPGEINFTGWVTRFIDEAEITEDIPAASVSTLPMAMFGGSPPLPHIANLNSYDLSTIGLSDKIIGAAPDGDNGKGLLGIYSRIPDESTYDALLRDSGLAMVKSVQSLASLDPTTYEPENGADYDTTDVFFRHLRDAVILLKTTSCHVAGIELGGFDTHSNQKDLLNILLSKVSSAFKNVYLDTKDNIWDDLVVVTLSEFGRTSEENGALGTDHGESGIMIAAGGAVVGDVYNCDSDTWANGDLFSTGRYVSHLTDFRTVLAEIIDVHFGHGDTLDDVIPGYDTLVKEDVSDQFAPLGFIAGK